ncbi:S8 family serine peptidase [Candidatus Woesearchaeota archaeon]|nr:S8 family serine peptidase [Candidatus Woesearchaeota archaeon]
MDRWMKGILVALLIIVILPTAFSLDIRGQQASDNVYDASSETTRVIVKVKEPRGVAKAVAKIGLGNSAEKNSRNSVILDSGIPSFMASLTDEEIEELRNDPNVEEIFIDRPMQPTLDVSVPLINATSTWELQYSGYNLTGQGQSICIIDTGVNYSHPDLGGCIGEGCKVIAGYDAYYANTLDVNIMDYCGHGTHVAGIAAANGSIKGVAPGASIVAVNAVDPNNCNVLWTSNISSGIQWCINNADTYNISVISMSLGDGTNNSNYCSDGTAAYINAAVAQNISVLIASGNTGNYTGISSPACVESAIPVSASDDNDDIASFAARNWMVQLMLPGVSILSTYYQNSGYAYSSGTSMSTPHAAGAFAIMNQYLELRGITRTPSQIESIFNSTGVTIYDGGYSNLNYSRIDLYEAIQSIDSVVPNVTLDNQNGSYEIEGNISLNCSVEDTDVISNTSLYGNWSSWHINQTNYSGYNDVAYSFVVELSEGDYLWNCEACDAFNCNYSTYNHTFYVRPDSDNDTIIDEFDNCVSIANPDQNDTDDDGSGDLCDSDDDNDGIDDGSDNLIGNASFVNISNSSISLLNISVNGSTNLSQIFTNSQTIIFQDSTSTVMEFIYDFASNPVLNFASVQIISQTNVSANGFVIIKGLNFSNFTDKKTVYMNKTGTSTNRICVKDQEIASLSEMSSSCNGANEVSLICDGTLSNGYTCILINSTTYKITGLNYSGIKEYTYTAPQSGSPGGGGGGGGGGSSRTAECVPYYKCDEWSDCINGYYRRECNDLNQCNSTDAELIPETMLRCERQPIVKKEVKTESPKLQETGIFDDFNQSLQIASMPKSDMSLLWFMVVFIVAASLLGIVLSFLLPNFVKK